MKRKITWGDKISKAKMGHEVSRETRRKIGLANKGKLLGDKNPARRLEIRKKISETRKGMKFSEGHKKNLSLSHKGKRSSPTTEFKKGHRMNRLGKNPAWKGGVSYENTKIRYSDAIKKWSRAVKKRDKYICQRTKVKGDKLIAHHIESFDNNTDLRLDIENGITLSKKSHDDFHKRYGYGSNTKKQLLEFLRKE